MENDFIKNIKHHCQSLKATFVEYFLEGYSEFFLIRNPFNLGLNNISKVLINKVKEVFIELSCDENLKMIENEYGCLEIQLLVFGKLVTL